jgi:3-oxoacyl-(acyl-carrier-protein) synthase
VTVGNACASGTDAIGIAKLWIEQGLCDLVIAGGTDELCRTTYLGFTALLLTSAEACKPFDKNRKGLNLGEGAGIVIVESDEHAKKRSAKILVEISGYGCNADAYHPTAPHPHGTGIKRAMTAALEQSGAKQNEIAFVNAHGTSTQENDLVEGKAIAEIIGHSIPVVSTKSFTGHTLGAAGAVEAVFTIQNLLDRKIPPTAGFETADPACAIVPSQSETPVSGKFAISNSLAFGGQNSVLVFRAAS